MVAAGRRLSIAAAMTLALAAGVAAAQEAPIIEPRADEILTIMSDLLAGAKQFTVHNDQTSDELVLSGDLVELSSSIDLAVRRPDAAHAVLHGDLRPMRYWIGGGRFTVLDVSRWTYAIAPVPADLDAAIEQIWERYGMKIPLADFISDNPRENLTRNVESGTYVGLHEIDGVPCHHLAFRQNDIDWQIWIEDGLLPLLDQHSELQGRAPQPEGNLCLRHALAPPGGVAGLEAVRKDGTRIFNVDHERRC